MEDCIHPSVKMQRVKALQVLRSNSDSDSDSDSYKKIPSLQEIIFCNYIECILTEETTPQNNTEYFMKIAFQQIHQHLDSWHNTELSMEIIRNYRVEYMKLFKQFYKLLKQVRDLFLDFAPNIHKIILHLIPSIKTLTWYYNHNFKLQMLKNYRF